MATAAPATIICGVTCACAEEQKAKARPGEDCVAHESCSYAKEGKCSCAKDTCVSSQNKNKCALAMEGKCNCGPGACQKMSEARQKCSANPVCDCAAGECKKANLPVS